MSKGPVMQVAPTNLGAKALLPIALASSQARVAQQLGCAQAHVWAWLHGARLPSARWRAQLEDAFGIPWRSWDAPTKRKAI